MFASLFDRREESTRCAAGEGGVLGGEGMHRSGVVMAWNVFEFCTVLRGLGSIMIFLVLGIIGVSYYAIVLTNYGPAVYSGALGEAAVALAILVLFHILVRFHNFHSPSSRARTGIQLEMAVQRIR